jgi:hypothetical protein
MIEHVGHQPANTGRELRPQPHVSPPGQIAGQIAGQLELGHDAQGGDEVAEIATHGRLTGQLGEHERFHRLVEFLDRLASQHHVLGCLVVRRQDSRAGGGDGVFHAGDHLGQKAIDLLETPVIVGPQFTGHVGHSSLPSRLRHFIGG